jgi:ABC-2 type transport system ATP-binding protein
MRRLLAVAALVGGMLLAAGPPALAPPAYGKDRVAETALTIAGTPEPDGRPVSLEVTLMTTDPAAARPAIVLAHGFGGTKEDLADTALT